MDNYLKPTTCRRSLFKWGVHTFVMGLVNLNPDSFSGDGLSTLNAAVEQARCFEEEGQT